MSTKDAVRPSNIDPRMRHILDTITGGRPDWVALENRTGVKAEKWRNFNRHNTKATTEMIEAIAEHYPQYAFWLVTGISDPKHGHVAPGDEGYPSSEHEQSNSTRYFQELLAEKKLAMAACHSWFAADDFPFRQDEILTDDMVRSVIQILHFGGNEYSIDLTELDDRQTKRRLAAKLRDAEVALYKDMPDLDFDETEHAVKAIERVLGDLARAEREMPEGTKIVTDKLNSLKTRIERHRNHPETLERIAKLRQLQNKRP